MTACHVLRDARDEDLESNNDNQRQSLEVR